MEIHVNTIRVSKKQLKKLDPHKIELHRRSFERGESVHPIDVVDTKDGFYNICGNGRHRYFGALEAGLTYIDVRVINLVS